MFALAHLSDPHLGPLPNPYFRELLSKRVLGYLNWKSNRIRLMTGGWLLGLTEAIREMGPDHIALTGDLVNLALDREIIAAADWLTELGHPRDVSLVPGNHDAYVPGAIRKAIEAWAPYMSGDGETTPAFPYVRRRGPVAIVGVSSARASAPWFATGRIGTRQTRALVGVLSALEAEGLFRILLIHHPPFRKATGWHKRLTDASRVRAVVKLAGCELVLHGHTHLATLQSIEGPRGLVPVVGVPSAANGPGGRHPAARYNLFRIATAPDNWSCVMEEHGYTPDGSRIDLLAERLLSIPDRAVPAPGDQLSGLKNQA